MAPKDEFYTAWDGRQYQGKPPPGWFLAADNRWWPNTETIDVGGIGTSGRGKTYNAKPDSDATIDDPSEEQQNPPEKPAAEPKRAPEVNQPPPSSWAPESNQSGGSPAEPRSNRQPASAPAGQPAARRKRGRGLRKFPLWPAIFFFFMLSRCGVFSGSAENIVTDDQSTPPTVQDVTVTSGCSPTFLWGSITNDSQSSAVFEARTERLDGGRDYRSEPIRVGPSETRSWVIEFPTDDVPDEFCPPVEIYNSP